MHPRAITKYFFFHSFGLAKQNEDRSYTVSSNVREEEILLRCGLEYTRAKSFKNGSTAPDKLTMNMPAHPVVKKPQIDTEADSGYGC